jgi:ferrous iron transport protein B
MMSIALVGMPNVGKTALFNMLTGSFQKVANFPGVTVEKKSALLLHGEVKVELVDLPGLYSLDVATLDEKVTRDWLMKNNSPILVVLDATHLKKSLYVLLQLVEIGYRPLVALTQMDQAERRGLKLDLPCFEKLLSQRVIPVSAVTGEGIELLVKALVDLRPVQNLQIPENYQKVIKEPDYIKSKFRVIDDWLDQIVIEPLRPETLTQRLDQYILHPIWGMIIMLSCLFIMFQALFTWATPLQEMIEFAIDLLSKNISSSITHPLLNSLIVEGIIAGVGSVIVFLPQIIFLFVILQILEDFGYLGRVAFLLDGLMRKLGLPGKAVVPLLSGHACAIPAIMSTRILEDQRERLISMLVIPLTTCSARLPVFTLLVAALVPSSKIWGVFSLQGLVMMALYLFPLGSAILVAFILRKVLPRTAPSMLLMELPPYRLPKLKSLWKTMVTQTRIFLSKAGKVILLFSLIIWVLVSFPRQEMMSSPEIEDSFAAQIGKVFEPLLSPLGFDWKIGTALIPAFGAREVLISSLATVFAVDGEDEAKFQGLKSILNQQYSTASLLALIVWFVFAPQCISTFAILRKESGGWRTPLIMFTYTLGLAWVMSFVTYTLFR